MVFFCFLRKTKTPTSTIPNTPSSNQVHRFISIFSVPELSCYVIHAHAPRYHQNPQHTDLQDEPLWGLIESKYKTLTPLPKK